MVTSLNTQVDLTLKAVSYLKVASYGHIMVGDKSIEFYNERNVKDYIQIPWEEISHVTASVMFGGRWIPRFMIVTHKSGVFTFSSRDNRRLLKEISKHIGESNMFRSLSFFKAMSRGFKNILKRSRD